MESTAFKLSAQEVVKEFSDAHGNLDLLRVYLITGSADIGRTYELVRKWATNETNAADKAEYYSALKILQKIEMQRILLTSKMYNIDNDIHIPVDTTAEIPETRTIMMVPQLDDLLERVKTMLKDTTSSQDAFELLKTTVGQGKVLNASGTPETWDNDMINLFISNNTTAQEDNSTTVDDTKKEETPAEDAFGFETIYGHFNVLIKNGKEEPEIKESLKALLMSKQIISREGGENYIIKDETVFEDYYNRILKNIVLTGITALKNHTEGTTTIKPSEITQKIEEEIKPFLEEKDKDETQISLVETTKKMQAIYSSAGIKKQLRDLFFDAKELALKWAPNLVMRQSQAGKSSIALDTTTPLPTEEKAHEIYDESHNIEQSNPTLWEEVKGFTYLNELFTKAQELYKAGNWRDALSMSIILITSGKIKETDSSKEVLAWDDSQIKLWYYNIVEASVASDQVKTIDVKTEIINEKKEEGNVPESSQETAQATEVKQGPVPQVGSIESKEALTRLLKDNSTWKDTYKFKSFLVRTDTHGLGAMSLEIVDATKEQEADLLITEHNMTAFITEIRDALVIRRNDEKILRKKVLDTLSPFYELSSSEAKRIVGNLVKEADAIRKANKANSRKEAEEQSNEDTSQETGTDNTVDIPAADNKEGAEVPPTTPAEESSSAASEEKAEPSTESSAPESTETGTEATAGEELTNTNEKKVPYSYEGFEDIVKAKNKIQFDKSIYSKVLEYANSEDGIKAVYDVVNNARRDSHFKKYFVRGYKSADTIGLLSTVNKAFTTGVELSKKQ